VAALLALHYRARYSSVRCWSFAPPGGLMSPAAAASLSDICTSLVSAKVCAASLLRATCMCLAVPPAGAAVCSPLLVRPLLLPLLLLSRT
jgi:hypothetical protein